MRSASRSYKKAASLKTLEVGFLIKLDVLSKRNGKVAGAHDPANGLGHQEIRCINAACDTTPRFHIHQGVSPGMEGH